MSPSRSGEGALSAFMGAARAAASPGDASAAAPSARRVGAGPRARTRERVTVPSAVSVQFEAEMKRLPHRTRERLLAWCWDLSQLLEDDPRRAVRLAADTVTGELMKLYQSDAETGDRLRRAAAVRLMGLAIEIAGIKTGRRRAPAEGGGND
jgi:hypothetical protein